MDKKFEVVTVEYLKKSTKRVQKKDPDIVILDSISRERNIALCERLKTSPLSENVKVILLSNDLDFEIRMWGESLRPDLILEKPFSILELTRILKNIINQKNEVAEKIALARHPPFQNNQSPSPF